MTATDARRIEALDGLRGMAALWVAVSHFANQVGLGYYIGNGTGQYAGVLLFFCLSGFLMGRLYLQQPFTASAVLAFARRRFARIVPLFLLATFIAYALYEVTGFKVAGDFNSVAYLKTISLWSGWGIFWTIPVEMQFYAVFPLLWWLAARTNGAWFIWPAVLALLLMEFDKISHPELAKYGAAMFVGVLLSGVRLVPTRAVANLSFVAIFALFVFLMPGIWRMLHLTAGEIWVSPLHIGAVGLLIWTTSVSGLAARLFGSGPLRFLGEISFSIYLWHMFVLNGLALTPVAHAPLLYGLIYFPVTIGLASLSWAAFERPTRRWLSGTAPAR